MVKLWGSYLILGKIDYLCYDKVRHIYVHYKLNEKTMLRRILLIGAIALFSLQLSAQPFSARVGVKGGFGSGKYEYTRSTYGDYWVSSSGRGSFHLGLFGRLSFLGMHIQPELNYTNERYSLRTMFNEEATASTVRINSVDLPVLFGVKLLWLRFQFGPVFNLSTDVSLRHRGGSNHWVHLDKATVSYIIGLGADIRRFTLDIRYNGEFKRPKQFTAVGDDDGFNGRMKHRHWTFSLGYMF